MIRKNDKTNGEAKRATAGRGETFDPVVASRQNGTHEKSEGTGVQGSEYDDSRFGERRNRGERRNKPINATFGEVLEHLANLETRYYKYVHAHQERLDLRRKESNESEKEFAQEAEELRAKILGLIGGFDQEELDAELNESIPETGTNENPE